MRLRNVCVLTIVASACGVAGLALGDSIAFNAAIVNNSPLAYYKFTELPPTDYSGNTKNATSATGVTLASSPLDQAANFSSSNIAIPGLGSQTGVTIEAIINPSLYADINVIYATNGWAVGDTQLQVNGGKLEFVVLGNTSMMASTAPALGAWSHVVATYDGVTGAGNLYVNGVSILSNIQNAGSANLNGGDGTGGHIGDWFWAAAGGEIWRTYHGDIDALAIYGTALSASDVGAHYAAYTATPEPSTAFLLVMGFVSLLAYAWRRRK